MIDTFLLSKVTQLEKWVVIIFVCVCFFFRTEADFYDEIKAYIEKRKFPQWIVSLEGQMLRKGRKSNFRKLCIGYRVGESGVLEKKTGPNAWRRVRLGLKLKEIGEKCWLD